MINGRDIKLANGVYKPTNIPEEGHHLAYNSIPIYPNISPNIVS
jgi:hypothetical protein